MKKKFLLLVVTLFVCSSFAFGAAACDLGSSSESSSSSEGASSEETIERESVESQGLVYELLDDDTYQVKGIGTCTDKEMGIPSTYKGKAVTSIADYAFAGNTRLTGVEIPDSIKSIGASAFGACSKLKNIYITSMEAWCNIEFAYNANPLPYVDKLYLNNVLVANLKIPDSVTTIGENAFMMYNKLESVEVGNGVTTIGDSAFSSCANLTSVTLGENVTTIGENAFSVCTALQFKEYGNAKYLGSETNAYFALIKAKDTTFSSYKVHDNTKTIADTAFSGCHGLGGIIIPDGVTAIGKMAFTNCYALTSVGIGTGVKSIGASAFSGCDRISEVNIKDLRAWCDISFGNNSANPINSNNHSYTQEIKLYLNGQALEALIIPEGVTTISDELFYGFSDLKSVVIPDSVTSIGTRAFYECSYLTSVTIGNGVTTIGKEAFYRCLNLGSITIGSGLTTIGEDALEGCYSLKSIAVADGNATYASQDGILYNKEKTEMLLIPTRLAGAVRIPDGITSIAAAAFADRNKLTSVEIPSSVTSIGEDVFHSCDALTSITVAADNAAYKSESGVLYNKEGTEFIHIPNNVTGELNILNGITFIPHSAFEFCGGLTSVTIPSSVTSIGSSAFQCCVGLTSVTIPGSVTSIGHNAFERCENLTSVTLEEGVITIGSGAFESCVGLTNILLPESVTSIGYQAFSGCDSLQFNEYDNAKYLGSKTNKYVYLIQAKNRDISSCTIHNDTKIIGPYAFEYCTNLTEVVIPCGVKALEENVFYCCSGLSSVTIENGVTTIGGGVFNNCTNLLKIVIPSSVTLIGNYAFSDCPIVIYCEAESQPNDWGNYWNGNNSPVVWDCNNNDVATDGYIYVMAEGLCYGLKESEAKVARQGTNIKTAKILESVTYKGTTYDVTSIANVAFYTCQSLTDVEIPESVTSIGDVAFRGCKQLTSVTIPKNVTYLGKQAFSWCTNLESVVISSGVRNIFYDTFDYCSKIKSVYYLGTAEDWAEIEIASGNDNLTSATVYYYIEKEEDVPTDGGNYWHYGEGSEIVAWITNEEL